MATQAKELFIQNASRYLLKLNYQIDPSIKNKNQPRFFIKDHSAGFYNYVWFTLNKYKTEYYIGLATSPFIMYEELLLANESAELFSYHKKINSQKGSRFANFHGLNVEGNFEEVFTDFKRVFEQSAVNFFKNQTEKLIERTNIQSIYELVQSLANKFITNRDMNIPEEDLLTNYQQYLNPILEERKEELELIIPANIGTIYRIKYGAGYPKNNIPIVSFYQFVKPIV